MKRRRVLQALALLIASACDDPSVRSGDAPPSAASASQSASAPGAGPTAIRSAAVFDGRSSQLRANVTVLIDGALIADVVNGQPRLGPDMRVVEASGLTLLPGLIDAHVHWRRWQAPLFLRHGVTTVRDVGHVATTIIAERDAQRRGEFAAPRIVAHGPLLDGVPPVWNVGSEFSPGLRTVEEAREIAAALLATGLDGLKTYARLPSDLLGAVVEVAATHGVPVAAHLGVTTARDAALAGVRSIEHTSGVPLDAPATELRDLAALLVQRGVFVVPTQIVVETWLGCRRSVTSITQD